MSRILLQSHHRTHKVLFPWRTEGIARALLGQGHEVSVLCTAETARSGLREYRHNGLRIVETPDLLRGRQRSGWDIWNLWQRRRWLHKTRFDFVHCFDTRPAVIHSTRAYLRRHPTPLLIDWSDWWGRGGLIEENRPRWYRTLFGRLEEHYEESYRRLADASTVIARGLSRRAVGLGVAAESIFWVPNGSTPHRVPVLPPAAHREEFFLPADAFVVGFNAADVTVGFPLILAAFVTARQRCPNLRLLITGNLPPAARVELSQISDGVHNLGFLATEAYTRALTCVDAFLLPFVDCPANYGRWPGRINDYLSAARPVITQPVGDMLELLKAEQIGLLADEKPDALAEAITQLYYDPNRCTLLGRNARRLAETRLSWDSLSETLQSAYACAARRHAERH